MSTTTDSTSRPLRRDAARNRALLLNAAREVFAARGLEATLDEIAKHAGVGVATAYRHFPNKQELAKAIFTEDLENMVERADSALEVTDPWEALSGFIEDTLDTQAHDRALYELMTTGALSSRPIEHDGKFETLRDALIGPVSKLVERAKAAGCVRADANPTDFVAILFMMGPCYLASDAVDRPVWQRYLWLLLDGLRAVDRPTLPAEPLDIAELDTALAAAKKH